MMLSQLQNKQIAIGGIDNDLFDYDSSHIHIYTGQDVLSPGILNLQIEVSCLFCALEWLAIVIGSYFKGIIYKCLYEKLQRKEFTEVDSLILANCVIQHIGILVYEIRKTIILVNGSSLEYILNHQFCSAMYIIMEFEFLYSVVGSLGVSVYRVLLVKSNGLIKNKIGVKVLRNIVLFVGLAITSFFITMMNMNNVNTFIGEKCAYLKDKSILKLIDNYQQSHGEKSLFSLWHVSRTITLKILAIMTVAEISIYSFLFHYMYKHDNNERLKRLLNPGAIRQRNRTNLLTFVGHFCLFVLKLALNIIFVLAVLFGDRGNGLWMISLMIKTISFAIISSVEVLMSASLRQRLCK